ncbi:MAG: DNA replication protein DnaD [Firmicutes bacterium HGW-Firmicutes-10]|jgi:DNA replication protein|nr:MAG: DNA replication protein DnaD [Firmicutes bacterium HGW-Firmicutes-10]
MWWKETYVNRRNWILQNFTEISVSPEEGMLLLMLDYMIEQKMVVDIKTLATAINSDVTHVDQWLSTLISRGYLTVKTSSRKVEFDLDGLFESVGKKSVTINSDVFDVVENEFGRPLSQKELTLLNQWSRHYPDKLITYALREASIMGKLSMAYIDKILEGWKQKGVTVEKLEESDHADNG